MSAGLLALGARRRSLAQERTRVVGLLIPFPEDEALSRSQRAVFVRTLHELGWRNGENLRLEVRHAVGDAELERHAAELAALRPGVLLVQSNQAVGIARRRDRDIPMVFVAVSDPVGSGFVADLARPGGNATGFTNFEVETGAKWLQVLREIAPRIERVCMLLDPSLAANRALARSVERAADSAGLEATQVSARERADIEQAITGLAGGRPAGIVVMPNPTNRTYQKEIIAAAARYRLPAMYPFTYYVKSGGLICYGVDTLDMFRLAGGYVDRILRGTKAGDLPVQQPTKYELAINLRAARALGVEVPGALLVRADEVIR